MAYTAQINPIALGICREFGGAPESGSAITPPEWIELVPAGRFQGRDGRWWINDRPDEIVAAFNLRGPEVPEPERAQDVPIDIEHATELQAPQGQRADAVGWIVEQAVRNGAVWGRADWNQSGRDIIAARSYRRYSPAYIFESETRRVVAVPSVALTNRQNFTTMQLNHQEDEMLLPVAILNALGLATQATDEDVVKAIDALKAERQTALNRAEHPPLELFVPRADHDAAVQRALNAEQALADDRGKQLEAQIEIAINAALEAKKITPATADYHRALCRQEGGLARFAEYVRAAPVIAAGKDVTTKPPEGEVALNSMQAAIAKAFGNSPEDLAKYAPAETTH